MSTTATVTPPPVVTSQAAVARDVRAGLAAEVAQVAQAPLLAEGAVVREPAGAQHEVRLDEFDRGVALQPLRGVLGVAAGSTVTTAASIDSIRSVDLAAGLLDGALLLPHGGVGGSRRSARRAPPRRRASPATPRAAPTTASAARRSGSARRRAATERMAAPAAGRGHWALKARSARTSASPDSRRRLIRDMSTAAIERCSEVLRAIAALVPPGAGAGAAVRAARTRSACCTRCAEPRHGAACRRCT